MLAFEQNALENKENYDYNYKYDKIEQKELKSSQLVLFDDKKSNISSTRCQSVNESENEKLIEYQHKKLTGNIEKKHKILYEKTLKQREIKRQIDQNKEKVSTRHTSQVDICTKRQNAKREIEKDKKKRQEEIDDYLERHKPSIESDFDRLTSNTALFDIRKTITEALKNGEKVSLRDLENPQTG